MTQPRIVERAAATINAQIADILADERYHYPPALVRVNAPLALEQVAMKARAQAFNSCLVLLGYPAVDIKRKASR